MDRENVGTERHDRDRAQIVDREALVLRGGLVDRQPGGRREDGVAVGRRADDRLRREIAAGTAAIFHHHCLSQALRQLLPHETRDDIGNAARREGDLERNVLSRIGLRRGRARQPGQDQSCQHEDAALARRKEGMQYPFVLDFTFAGCRRAGKLIAPA